MHMLIVLHTTLKKSVKYLSTVALFSEWSAEVSKQTWFGISECCRIEKVELKRSLYNSCTTHHVCLAWEVGIWTDISGMGMQNCFQKYLSVSCDVCVEITACVGLYTSPAILQ